MHADKQLLIDVDTVTVRLGSEKALEGVSFCVHAGEFIGLIGPNGAGKTTLLRAMLGLLRPTTGHVKRTYTTISYIPQRAAQYNATVPISVREVVELGAGHRDTARVNESLHAVQMHGVADRRFNELSGGQQQRVAIAKALAARAEILILDEPTTGIDERSQTEFYTLLRTLQQRGITIIMVSHDVDTVLSLVTRVICLNRGILYDGQPQHFEADKYLPAYYKARHLQLHHHHEEHHA